MIASDQGLVAFQSMIVAHGIRDMQSTEEVAVGSGVKLISLAGEYPSRYRD
jgi:hypothetical protein